MSQAVKRCLFNQMHDPFTFFYSLMEELIVYSIKLLIAKYCSIKGSQHKPLLRIDVYKKWQVSSFFSILPFLTTSFSFSASGVHFAISQYSILLSSYHSSTPAHAHHSTDRRRRKKLQFLESFSLFFPHRQNSISHSFHPAVENHKEAKSEG